MFVLFREVYGVSYVPWGLAAWLFYFISLLAMLVAPIFIALAMGNFWLRNDVFVHMPRVHFTDRCVLHYTTVLGKEKLWTCSEIFNQEFIDAQDNLSVLPFFSVYEEDRDGDGYADVITFFLSVPISNIDGGVQGELTSQKKDAAYRIEFFPEFFYEIDYYSIKVKMTAGTLFTFERSKWTSGATADSLSALTEGDLLFYTTEPLIDSVDVHYTNTYTDSAFDNVLDIDELLNLPLFASQYTERNQSVAFRPYAESVGGLALLRDENYDRVLGEDLGALGDFTWRITLRIQPAEVKYIPSTSEALKWAWVQYFSIVYVLHWVLWRLRGILVKLGLTRTIAIFHRKWKDE